MQLDGAVRGRQEGSGRVARFLVPLRCSRQDDVVGPQPELGRRQAEQGPARANLDVVRVRTDRSRERGLPVGPVATAACLSPHARGHGCRAATVSPRLIATMFMPPPDDSLHISPPRQPSRI